MGTFIKRSNKVHVIMILDESGSMTPQWDDTIGGANAYFEKLAEEKEVDYSISIFKFDTEYRTICNNLPISEVPKITRANYCPRGATALYDAVGKALNETEAKVQLGDKALVVIITDGEENSSVEQTETTIRPRIEKLQGQKNWTFVYLGAVANAWDNASKMGFYAGNVRKYNKATTGSVFNSVAEGSAVYACSSNSATMDFFDAYVPEDKGIEKDEDSQ